MTDLERGQEPGTTPAPDHLTTYAPAASTTAKDTDNVHASPR